MVTNAKIKSDIQRLDIDSPLVSLYSLDASIFDGGVYYFTPQSENGVAITFNGVVYSPLPVEFTGMETPGDGRLPRPHMKVANVNLTFVGLVNACQDGIGAKVTRVRTFQKYIDDHAAADSSAFLSPDVFYIEQKVSQNKYYIEWELVSPMDIGNKNIPRTQVVSYCPRFYRIYRDGAFNYNQATCPYTGTSYFTAEGLACIAASDKCGKRLSDCELRYPGTQTKPFKGFPGIGMIGRAYR